MQEFAVFWGCTIPARFPFIEKATRVALDDLGAIVHELEGHTCCPEGTLVKANAPRAFYAAAARNLALVERAGLDVVTPCNGCYSTFKEAQNHLATHRRERDEINRLLSAEDLTYEGDLRVWHLAEWLADDIGAGPVASRTVRSLGGLRLAVHYGCHLLRPQPAVRWDDPINPTKVEALVTALGGRVIDYTPKMQCGGGALDRVGERYSSVAFRRRKRLLDVTSSYRAVLACNRDAPAVVHEPRVAATDGKKERLHDYSRGILGLLDRLSCGIAGGGEVDDLTAPHAARWLFAAADDAHFVAADFSDETPRPRRTDIERDNKLASCFLHSIQCSCL